MIFWRISDIPLNTSRVFSVISTAGKFSEDIYFTISCLWHLKIFTGFHVISSTFSLVRSILILILKISLACVSHSLNILHSISYSCTTSSILMLAPTASWYFLDSYLGLHLHFILLYLSLNYFKILTFHPNVAVTATQQLLPKLNREGSVFPI